MENFVVMIMYILVDIFKFCMVIGVFEDVFCVIIVFVLILGFL